MKKTIVTLFFASTLLFSTQIVFANYIDVPETHWAKEGIDKAKEYEIMTGMGEGVFGLEKPVTRAEFATMLTQLFDLELSDNQFVGADDSKWYYTALGKIHGNNIAYTDEFFLHPQENITREEMAIMIVRGLGYAELAVTLGEEELLFTDVTEHKGSIALAYDLGIISGTSETTFHPKGTATREQTASIMVRVYEKLNAKTEWKHGFYAFSSYNQKEMAKDMDAVSLGWSRMGLDENGQVFLNTTSKNNNEWVVPLGYEEIISLLENHGVDTNLNVYMSLGETPFAKEILINPESRTTAIDAIIHELEVEYKAVGRNFYDGVTIDFENLKGEEVKAGFSAFLTELRQRLDEIDKTLYVAIQPILKNSSEYFDGYDINQIGILADKVILMAHDYSASIMPNEVMEMGFTTTPVTPFEEVYYALKTTLNQMEDKEKLVLALSMNTAGWTTKDGVVLNEKVLNPSMVEISEKLKDSTTTIEYSDTYRNPYIIYGNEDGSTTTIWYENQQSVKDKIDLGKMFGVNNSSIWRIGIIPTNDTLDVWSVINEEVI